MVLSNKKLKKKVRDLTVESVALAESKNGTSQSKEVNQEMEKLKEILLTDKIKGSRPPRRKKQPSESEGMEAVEDEDIKRGKIDGGDGDVESGKNKKMKEKKKNKKKKKTEEKEKENNGEEESREIVKDSIGGEVRDEKSFEPTKIEEREEKIYVGGMPYNSTEDDIRSFFESCGTLIEVDCMKFPESGKFRGIAFLTFKTEAAAKRALELDGADMDGFYLKIQPYKLSQPAIMSAKEDFAPQMVEGYNRIYAGNLSWNIIEDDLRKLLSDCNIMSIRFGEDKETGKFKGYAHVDFADSVSLGIALKLDRRVVCGRPVRIRCAVPLIKEKETNSVDQKEGEPNAFKHDGNAGSNLKPDTMNSETDGTGNGKKRKRTCYECGDPGHISTDFPQKKNIDTGNSAGANAHENKDNIAVLNSETVTSTDEGNKKKKRQTYYECGAPPGHLSSECLEKKTADACNPGGSNETEHNKNGVSSYLKQVIITVEGKKKKKKRQTCYECGVPGHLSSDCSQKKTASAVCSGD